MRGIDGKDCPFCDLEAFRAAAVYHGLRWRLKQPDNVRPDPLKPGSGAAGTPAT